MCVFFSPAVWIESERNSAPVLPPLGTRPVPDEFLLGVDLYNEIKGTCPFRVRLIFLNPFSFWGAAIVPVFAPEDELQGAPRETFGV